MNERLKFVARLLDGEKMTTVCREFGISRKTGYKIYNRYKDVGFEGLRNQSRRPYRQANKLPFQIERSILQLKQERPTWGALKIREKLIRMYPQIKRLSNISSVIWSSFVKMLVIISQITLVRSLPLIRDLHQQCRDETQARCLVRKQSHDASTTSDLLIHTFQ